MPFAHATGLSRIRTIGKCIDFKIEMDDGQLKSVTSNQDSIAILTFVKDSANLAAKAAGVAVSSSVIKGTFGLESGIYRLDGDGIFRRVIEKK